MANEAAAVSSVVAFPMPSTGTDLSDSLPRGPVEQRAVDYRLVIEEGPRQGTFIYKTVDRTTGETIKQYPREEVVKLIESPLYATGTVADTKA